MLSSLPFGGVTDGNGSDCEYGSVPHTILESEGRPWSRIGRVKWSKESELELELSPGSLRTICLGGILPGGENCDLKLVVKLICQLSKLNTKIVILFPFLVHITSYQGECLLAYQLEDVLTSCGDPCRTAS